VKSCWRKLRGQRQAFMRSVALCRTLRLQSSSVRIPRVYVDVLIAFGITAVNPRIGNHACSHAALASVRCDSSESETIPNSRF